MTIPVFKLNLSPDEDSGIEYVALVDKPAIMVKWQAFSHQQVKTRNRTFQFKTVDAEKQIISGPIMIANLPMLRQDETGSYYAYFDEETIRKVVQRFFKQQHAPHVNLMHNSRAIPEGVYLFESFIIDSARGIHTPAGFDPLPDGSWFGSYKIDNPLLWQDYIKTGLFTGFSIEGHFVLEPSNESSIMDDVLTQMIVELLESHLS